MDDMLYHMILHDIDHVEELWTTDDPAVLEDMYDGEQQFLEWVDKQVRMEEALPNV